MKLYEKVKKYAPERIYYAYIGIVFSILASAVWMASYWLFWKFLEEGLVKGEWLGSFQYALWIVFSLIVYGFLSFAALWFSHLLAFRLEGNLRKKGIENLLRASFSFFDQYPSGGIRKVIDDNAAETHTIIAHLIPDLVAAIFVPCSMLFFLFFIDIRLGVSFLVMMAFGFYLIKDMVGEKTFMEQYMAALEKMNSEAVEYVRGMQVLKIFQNTIYSFKNFYQSIHSYSTLAFQYTNSCRRVYVFFQVIFHLFFVLVVPFGLFFISRGESESLWLAKMIFYVCLAGSLFLCYMKIMYVGMYHFQALQVIETLENLFGKMESGIVKEGKINSISNFNIRFENISFQYGEEKVLENLSFSLEEKKTYALVGASGSGKSTIAKLIAGFYPVQSGKILFGENEIEEYTEHARNSQIAFVFQNAKLFPTTIFENVKIGKENATKEEVMDALRKAQCEDILEKFPLREETVLGAQGVMLSGGEKQRIAIARAILKNADLIILDEASAAADPENEYELQRAFSNLMKGKTAILIAHRLSSIRNVDEVLVLEAGKIIERGRDKDLMQQKGRYYELQTLFAKANEWRV